MKNNKPKIVLRTMIFIICVFIAVGFTYQNIIVTIQDNKNATINSFKEEQFKIIWKYLEGLQTQSKVNVTKISESIEKDILNLSNEESKQVQSDMSSDIFNNTLNDIIMKHIENISLNNINNHRNGIVVMSNSGFIEDFNYRRAKVKNDDFHFRSWEDSINNSYNKELDKNAIDKILNRTSGVIALESYDLIKNEDHIMLKELTYDSLFEVYLNEGLNGLRNYQIFVPYYITDIGDIFGVPDITQGVKNDNNKIIIAQEFNLYDQLTKNDYDDIFNNNKISDIIYRYNIVLRLLYVFGALIATTICILMFWACTYYNHIIDKYKEMHLKQDDNIDDYNKEDKLYNE